MTRMRRYATNAQRQAAYHSREDEALGLPVYLPALCPLSCVSEVARWRLALDLAARLLQNVGEEMQAYSDERSEHWNKGKAAERLYENLDQVNNLQGQLEDLRSEF